MKQVITKRLSIVIAVTMLFVLVLNFFLQIESAHEYMSHNANATIDRIESLLVTNEQELERLKETLKEEYIIRARAVSYVLEMEEQLENDVDEMRKLAEFLQVDEICFYDKQGTICGGTHPEYYGLSMFSGEQISFFIPMLTDKSLALCQDLFPNTSKEKPMMYAAVWRDDGTGIVQVGLEPERILETIDDNRPSRIFSNLTVQQNTVALLINADNGTVTASTKTDLLGRPMEMLLAPILANFGKYFYTDIDGVAYCSVFRQYEDQYIGVLWESRELFADLTQSMLLVLLYLVVAAVMMIASILRSIDSLVIDNIHTVNEGLSEITRGKLDTTIRVNELPEFVELSSSINQMTDSLLNTSAKITRILDATDALMGFFEYSAEKKSVLTTRRVSTILAISPDEMDVLTEDKERFRDKIREICSCPVPRCKNVYRLPTETACYVKLEIFEENGSTLGIVMDVTEEIIEKERLRHERDHDLLTQLYCRRAFYRNLNDLFDEPEKIGEAVMLMFDLDGLKGINDSYGHAGGDKAIREAANLLESIECKNKVTARLSGDEFAAFLYGVSDREELKRYIDDLYRRMIVAEVSVFGQVIPVRLSGGYVFYSDYPEKYTDLLRKADQALYYSKKNGKAKFSSFSDEMSLIEL